MNKYLIIKLLLFYIWVLLPTLVWSQDDIDYGADQQIGQGNRTILRGNVRIRQGNLFVKCEEATVDNSDKSFRAEGNVRVKQDVTIIRASTLDYDGSSRMGKFRQNVELQNEGMTLYTDFLDFNSSDNSGYFFNGGKVIDSVSTLTCIKGYYYQSQTLYFFKDSVRYNHPDYKITTDTLKFNYRTKVVNVQGPTNIKQPDGTILYCEKGWYNTAQRTAQFEKRAYMKTKTQTLKGDKLFYDKPQGISRATGKVEMIDTADNIIIRGQLLVHYDSLQRSVVTGKALMMSISETDTIFMHADTLVSVSDSITGTYTLFAYKRAKMYSRDFQALCDSLVYSSADSVMHLFTRPIVWADNNQVTAEHIQLYTSNNKLQRMEIIEEAFMASAEDSAMYNQIKGEKMIGFFDKNKLSRLDVTRNAQSVYFIADNGEVSGVNQAECNDMRITLKENKVARIVFLASPSAKLTPINQVKMDETLLKNFFWYSDYRPMKQADIFTWKPLPAKL